jgi:hypothetical protein
MLIRALKLSGLLHAEILTFMVSSVDASVYRGLSFVLTVVTKSNSMFFPVETGLILACSPMQLGFDINLYRLNRELFCLVQVEFSLSGDLGCTSIICSLYMSPAHSNHTAQSIRIRKHQQA